MDFDFIITIRNYFNNDKATVESFFDQLIYSFTPTLLLLMTFLVGIRQYIFTPIQCWIPNEWNRFWEQFTESYCYIEDKYSQSIDEGPSRNVEERFEFPIKYYQWIPFFFALQAVMFYIPHQVWRFYSSRNYTHFNHLVRRSRLADLCDRGNNAAIVSSVLRDITVNSTNKPKTICIVFHAYKAFQIVLCIIQVQLTAMFLGQTFTYGWNMMVLLHQGQHWSITNLFPRVVWCDIAKRDVANKHLHSIMCVLPNNLLNEKFFLIIWWWYLCLATCSFISLINNVIFMSRSVDEWIMKALRFAMFACCKGKPLSIMFSKKEEEKKMLSTEQHRLFVKFLPLDVKFLLTRIEARAGRFALSRVIISLFQDWQELQNTYQLEASPYKSSKDAKLGDNAYFV